MKIEGSDSVIRDATQQEIDNMAITTSVPSTIKKIQIKRQFVALGRWDEFKALKASSESTHEDWELVTGVTIDSELANVVAAAMGLDINEFFTEASKL